MLKKFLSKITLMVLFYLQHSIPNKLGPRRLIDRNVRIDYEKLRHLMWVNQQLNGNFNLLKSIIEEGSIVEDLVESFPLNELTEAPNFVSLIPGAPPPPTIQKRPLGSIRQNLPSCRSLTCS